MKTDLSHFPADLSEGDSNLSAGRRDWLPRLDGRTRQILAEDAHGFMHQSLSTPCLDVLAGCQGSYVIDLSGRRILDFHGNGAHTVGYGHPVVIDAVIEQPVQLGSAGWIGIAPQTTPFRLRTVFIGRVAP